MTNDQITLAGIAPVPLPLWSRQERMQHALANIAAAKKLPGATTAIFFGIEHLPILQRDWDTHHPAIVIEKCAAFVQAARDQGLLLPPQASHPQLWLCTGEHGFRTPLAHTTFAPIFYSQEIGQIALQLFALPENIWHDIAIFQLPAHEWDAEYYERLHQAIALVQRAHAFHREHADRYAALRARPRGTRNVLLCLNAHDRTEQDRMFHYVDPQRSARRFVIGNHGAPYNYTRIFGGVYLSRDDVQGAAFEKYFAPYCETALQLLAFLEADPPPWVMWQNLRVWCTLEDVLLSWGILQHVHIPCGAFFSDWFFQQNSSTEGGFAFDLIANFWDTEQLHYFTIFPYEGALYRPARIPTSYFPYPHTDPSRPSTPPVQRREELARDIAIIHHPNTDVALAFPEVNELFDLLERSSTLPRGVVLHRYLWRLRHYMQTQPAPGDSLFLRHLLNMIDQMLYRQSRIRDVQELRTKLPSHCRLTVYGRGWERVLPQEICGGPIAERDRLFAIYRQSFCLIDLTVMFSHRNPTFNVIECLQAGGFPFMATPSCDENPATVGFAEFDRQHLQYFSDVSQLATRLPQILSDWDARQSYIREAQTGWLHQLHMQDFRTTVDTLTHNTLSSCDPGVFPISHDAQLDQQLIEIGLGYLHTLAGYFGAALEIWERTFVHAGPQHAPLALRAAQLAERLGDTARQQRYRALAATLTLKSDP